MTTPYAVIRGRFKSVQMELVFPNIDIIEVQKKRSEIVMTRK